MKKIIKLEANEAHRIVTSLSKEVEDNKKQLAQERTATLQIESQLKTLIKKLEAEKR